MGAATELEFDPYTDGGAKFAARMTVDGRTNIAANLWNVSGGGSVAADNVVSVKINSDWLGIDQEQEAFTLALGSFTSSNICKLAGRGDADGDEIWFGGGPADGGASADGADERVPACWPVRSRPIRQRSRLQTLRPQPSYCADLVPTVQP